MAKAQRMMKESNAMIERAAGMLELPSMRRGVEISVVNYPECRCCVLYCLAIGGHNVASAGAVTGMHIKQEPREDFDRIISKELSKRMSKLKIRPDRLPSQLLFAGTVIGKTLHIGGSMSERKVRLAVNRSRSRFSFSSHVYHNCPISTFVNKVERLLNEKAVGDVAVATAIAVFVKKEAGVAREKGKHESPKVEKTGPKEQVVIKIEDVRDEEAAIQDGQKRYDGSMVKRTVAATKTIVTKNGLEITIGSLANKTQCAFTIIKKALHTGGDLSEKEFGLACTIVALSLEAADLPVERENHTGSIKDFIKKMD